MELKKFVTPAIVGVVSFAAGIGAYYAFERYRNSKASGFEPQDENGNYKSENSDDDDKSSDGHSEAKQLVSRIERVGESFESGMTQMQFMFEERDRKNDVTLQQAMKVIATIQDEGSKFLSNLKHDSEEHEFAVIEEGEHWNPEENDDWDYTEEVQSRSSDRPYIIHRDEYFGNEMEFEQSTLTYYKGDNILCDDLDVPVYQPEKVVGPLKFGHGSLDPSIVYIRNEELQGEYEVLLEYGTFEDVILEQKVSKDLGVRDLKHSLMKFREE
jgi:hypothetical protein